MDYSVFDPFLRVGTWHSSHDFDDERFYRCLSQVVENSDFDPDAMGKYIRGLKGVDSEEHPYAQRVQDLVDKAWAVHDYLKTVSGV